MATQARGAADPFILALDLGTSGMKVAVCTSAGAALEWEMEPCQVIYLPGGGAEQRPEDWWLALVRCMDRLQQRCPEKLARIRAVCASTHWSGTIPVNSRGEPLHNAILWMDTRGATDVRRTVGGLIRFDGYSVWKMLRWIRLTGGLPSLSGKDSIAHILYLRSHHPEIYDAAHLFLEPKDWLNARLCGRMVCSSEAILLHWVTDNRDLQNIKYDPTLLKWVGIAREKLPDLVPCTEILGPLLPEVARALHLPSDVVLVGGLPDVHAAALGSGAIGPLEPHLCIGTSSWLGAHVPEKRTDLFRQLASIPSALPDRYLLVSEQECAGGCLNFLRDSLLFPDGAPPDVWSILDGLVTQSKPGAGNVIFTPWLYGERAPVDDHTVRGGFFNLSMPIRRPDLVRAVYEGVAFNTRWLLGGIEHFCGRKADVIRFVGGGAKSHIWSQILADVLERPIARVKDPMQTNARGVALLAAVALGARTWDELSGLVAIEETLQPNPQTRDVYGQLFDRFLEIFHANRRIYAKLNRHD